MSATGTGWTCDHAAGVVTCSRSAALAVGAVAPPVRLIGTVNAAAGTVTNSASVAPSGGGVADPDTSDNTALASVSVVPGADLRIAQKSVASALPATAGDNISFVIQPRNSGPADAVNAVVSDVLPAGWTFVSASGPNWVCSNSGQTMSCIRASFAVGATDNLSVVARAPASASASASVAAAGTTFTNTASISSATPDPVGTNNSGAADVLVRRDGADLRLAKTKTPNPVALGSAMVSTITVTNNGPRTATGPLLVVEALSGELFVAASGSGWTCTVVGAAVVCEHPNTGGLAVGAALPNLLITSTATVAGAARNEACTGNSLPTGVAPGQARPPAEGDPNASNDCVTVSATSTTLRPDLAISKTALTPVGGDSIVSVTENSVTYRLVVDNASPGSDAASGVRISDGVPGFIADRSSFGSISTTVSAGTATFACSGSTAASQRGRRAGRAGEQCGDGGRWW